MSQPLPWPSLMEALSSIEKTRSLGALRYPGPNFLIVEIFKGGGGGFRLIVLIHYKPSCFVVNLGKLGPHLPGATLNFNTTLWGNFVYKLGTILSSNGRVGHKSVLKSKLNLKQSKSLGKRWRICESACRHWFAVGRCSGWELVGRPTHMAAQKTSAPDRGCQ